MKITQWMMNPRSSKRILVFLSEAKGGTLQLKSSHLCFMRWRFHCCWPSTNKMFRLQIHLSEKSSNDWFYYCYSHYKNNFINLLVSWLTVCIMNQTKEFSRLRQKEKYIGIGISYWTKLVEKYWHIGYGQKSNTCIPSADILWIPKRFQLG